MDVKPILGVNSYDGLGLVSREYQLENSGIPSDIQKENSEDFSRIRMHAGMIHYKKGPKCNIGHTTYTTYTTITS